jgi:uracil-DNA glycosylase
MTRPPVAVRKPLLVQSAPPANGGVLSEGLNEGLNEGLSERLGDSLTLLGEGLHPGWQPLWSAFLGSPEGQALAARLEARRAQGAAIYPPQPLRALQRLGPQQVRVLILGQDPYHGPGQALGVAFGVATGHRLPPSLRNILREVEADLARPPSTGPDLQHWLGQGVLLLNACLTVEQGQPQSHSAWGWEAFTDACVRHLAQQQQALVFMLWGASAQAKRPLVGQAQHLVLVCNHPSPLSARRGPQPFLGCRHFSQAQAWLERHTEGGEEKNPIDW